ncbi:DUF6059 family protein [Streptomyces sp. NPDC090119]|uniref:DUF6059 family protein n=1 Tax=Streptomyces sp. NPDC090119 TaxID=3365951 RepID=UPI00381C0572
MDAWSLTSAFLRGLGRSLAAAGYFWIYLPPPDEPVRGRDLLGPPPGHPEQVRPDLPLSAVERHLARSLSHPKDVV